MLYAISPENEKIEAFPGAVGRCQLCDRELIAKCGKINKWHWAHLNLSEQCEGYEETEWHLEWKRRFPSAQVEVIFTINGIKKIADVVDKRGNIIELQHSPISPDEINIREKFYGNITWIFDCQEPYEKDRLTLSYKDGYQTFRWSHPRKHLSFVTKPLIFDLGMNKIFKVRKLYPESTPFRGWGVYESYQDFIDSKK